MAEITLISPSSGISIEASGQGYASVTFKWTTSFATTGFELNYKLESAGSWTTVSETSTAKQKTVTLSEGAYVWQVRVQRSDNTWTDWSDTRTFGVYKLPTVAITAPVDESTQTSLPIPYTVTFTDNYGVMEHSYVRLYAHGDQTTLWSADDTLSGNIDLLLPNGAYDLIAWCQSSTGFNSAFAESNFTVNVTGTDKGELTFANDANTGYTTITVSWDNSGGVHATSATLYRVNADGTQMLLGDGLAKNDTVVDKYAPLNTEVTYQVVTHAEPTATTFATAKNTIVTDRWFVIWANGDKQAWAIWNPSGGYDYKRPQKKRVHYVGREYPVSYDGTALDEEHSISFTVLDRGSWTNAFIDLMHDGGRGIYKSVDGKVFWADVDISCTPKYTSLTKIGTVSIGIVRIEGDAV